MNWLKRLFGRSAEDRSGATNEPPGAVPSTVEELRKRYQELARPAIHLLPSETPGFSRLGGLPLLPPGVEWPAWKGKPQAFLAQLDLAEIHKSLPSFLPKSGYLFFFYDQEQSVWGFDPADAGAWQVIHANGNPEAFREREAPSGLPESSVYRPKLVLPKRIEVLPDSQSLPRTDFVWDRDGDAYQELLLAPYGEQIRHQMLGYACPVQDDEMAIQCQLVSNGINLGNSNGTADPRHETLKAGADDWRLLLQLDTDDDTGWMWGDVGTIYFWVRESDARDGGFSKVWMVFQCC